MSHNVVLSDVKITDVRMLKAAVDEMVKEGLIDARLVENGNCRGYAGRLTRCDLVLSLPRCEHDVGFVKQADGSYVPLVEAGSYDIRSAVGAARDACNVDGEACDLYRNQPASYVGRLLQRMNVIKTEAEAVRKGYQCVRQPAAGGVMNVVISI